MTNAVGLTPRTLSTLVEWESPLVVSAFVPVDFARPQPTEPIVQTLRRLAQVASATLIDRYRVTQGAATEMLAPVVDPALLDEIPTSSRGLAVFVSADDSLAVWLPICVGPAVEVGHKPDLLRLLPAFVGDVDYFALTIGKKGAQLYRGSQFHFESMPVTDMPGSMEDALWYIKREPVRTRVGSGMMHGSGGDEDLRKDDVRQYLHLVDKAITPVLNGSDAPLVVIGVEYEAAMFINHTHYRHVVDIPVAGSPDAMSMSELHRRSWDFVCRGTSSADDALSRLRELAGTGRTVTELEELVTGARQGQVDELLVARSATDDERSPVPAVQRPAVVKIVNETIRHRGRIHVIDDESLTADARVAAILRY
jgi:hypothetical protein